MEIKSSDLSSNPNSKDLYADYKFSGSMYNNPTHKEYLEDNFGKYITTDQEYSLKEDYFIPLNSVRGQVFGIEDYLVAIIRGIEDSLLRKIYINPYTDIDLIKAHQKVWQEACKYLDIPESNQDIIQIPEYPDLVIESEVDEDAIPSSTLTPNTPVKDIPPDFICFDEYIFAEKYKTTACRDLISEYDELISQSTFSYFFQFRKLLIYIYKELLNIKQSLLFDFKDDYENESQQKIALRYDTWAKMALHYTRRVAGTVLSKPGEIPHAEMDKISKTHAAKFQAFFAIRLNALDEEINDLLESIKRDLVDNSEIFYKRFISNSLKMNSEVAEPLDLEFETTNFIKEFPSFSRELVVATNLLSMHFASVHADLIHRFELLIARIDAIMMAIQEKRKLAHYISQLSEKAIAKRQILVTVVEDKYSSLFKRISVDQDRNLKYTSNHSSLDGLLENDHPQYLLKDGGNVTGDISFSPGIRIDGISPSSHSHNGIDGSTKISIFDIDFSKSENSSNPNYIPQTLQVGIEGFVSDIIDGGIPVFDTIVSIQIPDEDLNEYEYELSYIEIEQ